MLNRQKQRTLKLDLTETMLLDNFPAMRPAAVQKNAGAVPVEAKTETNRVQRRLGVPILGQMVRARWLLKHPIR
jgi:hypothetical protein